MEIMYVSRYVVYAYVHIRKKVVKAKLFQACIFSMNRFLPFSISKFFYLQKCSGKKSFHGLAPRYSTRDD